MIFAIKRGGTSEAVYYRVKELLKKTVENLKEAKTSIELIWGRPSKILVWGLVAQSSQLGSCLPRAPLICWKKKFTIEPLKQQARMVKKKNHSTFRLTLFSLIKIHPCSLCFLLFLSIQSTRNNQLFEEPYPG